MSLRVGHIAYANCAPFFTWLRDSGFAGEVIPGVPAELNRMLARGEIDLAPSSSIEYACHPADYLILPGHSISARGPVQSVLVFSPLAFDELGSETIALTGESATSVNLLKVLLADQLGADPRNCRPADAAVESIVEQGGTALVIGDRALRLAQRFAGQVQIHDLGALWHAWTGLPFVFALWIVRRDAVIGREGDLADLYRQLSHSRKRAFADLPALAATAPERAWMSEAALVDYWRCVDYDLNAEHLAGLERFFALCCRYGLISAIPQLNFAGVSD